MNGEVGSLKNTESKLRSEVSRLNGETDLLKRAESGLKAEVSRLKSEIGSLKNVESGLKAEVARLNGKRTELEQAESKLKSELFSEKKAKAGTEEKLRKKTAENSELTTLVRAKDAEGKRLETEKTSLKAEIAKLRTDVSKEKSELEAEKSLLEEKNQSLRRELLDTLERCAKLADRLKRLELSVAGVLDTLNPVYVGQRESELTDALDLVMQCGMRLAGTGTNVCDLLLPRLDKLGLSTVEKARIKVA